MTAREIARQQIIYGHLQTGNAELRYATGVTGEAESRQRQDSIVRERLPAVDVPRVKVGERCSARGLADLLRK